MKYILKFSLQTIALVLIYSFWFIPYLIWNAKKHEDHNDVLSDYRYCYRKFKRQFKTPHNAL